jgi:hypothetical protein
MFLDQRRAGGVHLRVGWLVLGKADADRKACAVTLATGVDDPSCAVDWRCARAARRPAMDLEIAD